MFVVICGVLFRGVQVNACVMCPVAHRGVTNMKVLSSLSNGYQYLNERLPYVKR